MNQGASCEEIEIKNGKVLMYILFGATRWEFEKLPEEGEHLPEFVEGCLTRMVTHVRYLTKTWGKIPVEDREMAAIGITQEIESVKSCGYSIQGIKSYRKTQGSDDARNYSAYLRIIKDE